MDNAKKTHTKKVGPCRFSCWLTSITNVAADHYPCELMFPSSHVNKVLSDQVCNDGVVAHLKSKSCKCLQPCESVQFQSSEQYDLLTDGGWQRGGNQTLLSFAEITVASQIDSFTEFNPFPFGKLIGAAGGAI